MIAYLQGKVKNKGQGFIILEVNKVGYKIFINPTQFAEMDINQEVEFYVHQYVREDILALYGFNTLDQLEMFELLLSISGIGPKSALGVFAITNTEELREAISRGDSSLLTKVSGIGQKTAERIVLELRSKVGAISGDEYSSSGSSASGDEIDALVALGYSLPQAREALKNVDPEIKESSQRIKQALKNIGK